MVLLVGEHGVAAPRPTPAVLTAVDVVDSNAENCRIALRVSGDIGRIDTARLEGGRFVYDLAPVVWEGPTRRQSPNVPGILEYRYSQFSRDPLIARFVVDVDPTWSCVHTTEPRGIEIACGGAPILRRAGNESTIAVVRGVRFSSPLDGLDADGLIERSLGFTPHDIVRDGLPHFGSMRDDWIGKPRPHQGLDIYVDHRAVLAVAAGAVAGVGLGQRAGGWATIDHGGGVETVYVHVSGLEIEMGARVSSGQTIAMVNGAVGNAIQPQLHFELRLDGEAVDPVPYLFELAPDDLKSKILLESERLEALERERASRVRSQFEGRHD
jgi:hypothetical protein